MNDGYAVAIFIAIGVLTSLGTWNEAKSSVADNCDKVGGFHVRDRVYTCEVKK
jgi:hypothetical protein